MKKKNNKFPEEVYVQIYIDTDKDNNVSDHFFNTSYTKDEIFQDNGSKIADGEIVAVYKLTKIVKMVKDTKISYKEVKPDFNNEFYKKHCEDT